MKKKLQEIISIPEGINCDFSHHVLSCSKNGVILRRMFRIPGAHVKIDSAGIILESEKGNKREYKAIKSSIAHIKNMFNGLSEPFTYVLEACNVHFPMTLKKEGNELIINNFLGEKVPRKAKIFPDVNVEVKGQKITIVSADKEAAGHTAASIEKATKIRNRDRRIFQDGIFIVQRPAGAKA